MSASVSEGPKVTVRFLMLDAISVHTLTCLTDNVTVPLDVPVTITLLTRSPEAMVTVFVVS